MKYSSLFAAFITISLVACGQKPTEAPSAQTSMTQTPLVPTPISPPPVAQAAMVQAPASPASPAAPSGPLPAGHPQ